VLEKYPINFMKKGISIAANAIGVTRMANRVGMVYSIRP